MAIIWGLLKVLVLVRGVAPSSSVVEYIFSSTWGLF